MTYDLVDNARQLATAEHAGQFRRDGVTPYIAHPAAVAASLTEPKAQAVAWLHDILEDCDVTVTLLRLAFPGDVVDAVMTLTKRPGQDYQDYICQILLNPLARQVKIADIKHNLSCDPTDSQCKRYAAALAVLEDHN